MRRARCRHVVAQHRRTYSTRKPLWNASDPNGRQGAVGRRAPAWIRALRLGASGSARVRRKQYPSSVAHRAHSHPRCNRTPQPARRSAAWFVRSRTWARRQCTGRASGCGAFGDWRQWVADEPVRRRAQQPMWRIGSQMPPSRMMIPCVVAAALGRASCSWPGLVPAGAAALAGTAAARSPATTPRVATDRLRVLLNMMCCLPGWVACRRV
jgi:hypothetical protein